MNQETIQHENSCQWQQLKRLFQYLYQENKVYSQMIVTLNRVNVEHAETFAYFILPL